MVLKAHPTDPDKLIFDNKDRIELLNALTAPPQREWQGLTAEDLAEIPPSCYEGAIWADARLKEKNT